MRRAATVVWTPSATIFMPARISRRVRPLPSSWPTRWFRLSSPVQVRTRSPIPANPEKVSFRAPRATPSLVISTSPRVMSAALEFSPNASASTMPAAMAMTFFRAPATSTPVTSLDV